MTGTQGNYARPVVNGIEFDQQGNEVNYAPAYKDVPVPFQNIGIKQHTSGYQQSKLTLSGFKRTGNQMYTAHSLLSPSGSGNTNDTKFVVDVPLGMNATPAVGDYVAWGTWTLGEYTRGRQVGDKQTFNAPFSQRGERHPLYGRLLYFGSFSASSLVGTPVQVSSAALALGGVAHLHVLTPTGTAATGSLGASGLPSDGDNFVVTIGGMAYTYTFKTLPSAAGHVLIGGTAAACMANLYYAMIGSPVGLITASYYTGTTPIPQDLSTALVIASYTVGGTSITLTAVNTGIAANSYTLVKSGTNLTVSGATMSGGVAGETITVTIQTATTSGGSYTTNGTFTLGNAARAGERIEIAIGTTLNMWARVNITKSGSANTIGLLVSYSPFWHVR